MEGPAETLPEPPPADADSHETAAEAKSARDRDEQGRFAPKTVKELADAAARVAAPAVAKAGVKAPAAVAPAAAESKAPQSLTAVEKEAFRTWPKEAQAAFVRREKEAAVGLQRNAEAVRRDQAWNQAVSPYIPSIQAMGGDVIAVAQNYFRTGYMLQHGQPAQKADIVASIIRDFGVDIDTLAARLDGQSAPQGQGQGAQQPAFDPSLVDQRVEQRLQQFAQQRAEHQGLQEIAAFEKTHPYFSDVSQTMGHLMASAIESGSTMDMERAYTLACQATPEVSEALARQRTSIQPTSRVRAAAGSLKSRPSMPNGQQSDRPKNARDVAAEAYDALVGR